MWTQFFDMSSGGSEKTEWTRIYIEAPLDKAVRVFEKTFYRSPYNVTCECCGPDFAIYEDEELDGSANQESSLIIHAEEIKE
jgi:hypothetical protein